MTNKEIEMLLTDLCCRIPYNVKVNINGKVFTLESVNSYGEIGVEDYTNDLYPIEEVKPYLRSLESQTDAEMEERNECVGDVKRMDYYYAHHLDCHYLIKRGMALEATEDMYV